MARPDWREHRVHAARQHGAPPRRTQLRAQGTLSWLQISLRWGISLLSRSRPCNSSHQGLPGPSALSLHLREPLGSSWFPPRCAAAWKPLWAVCWGSRRPQHAGFLLPWDDSCFLVSETCCFLYTCLVFYLFKAAGERCLHSVRAGDVKYGLFASSWPGPPVPTPITMTAICWGRPEPVLSLGWNSSPARLRPGVGGGGRPQGHRHGNIAPYGVPFFQGWGDFLSLVTLQYLQIAVF